MPVDRFVEGIAPSGKPLASRRLDSLVLAEKYVSNDSPSSCRAIIGHGLLACREHGFVEIPRLLSDYAVSTGMHQRVHPSNFVSAPLAGYFVVGSVQLFTYELLRETYPDIVVNDDATELDTSLIDTMAIPRFSSMAAHLFDRIHASYNDSSRRRHILGVLNNRADAGLALMRAENQHFFRAVSRIATMLSSSTRERILGERCAGLVYSLVEPQQ